ncbi:RHS repeat protein [Pseudomonas sp. TH39(2020)]|uniref:RHS repeat-associated core domain-containing protein n=1 Tax=Pseudomonas sp. TH39(2020) TaxID=2796349 RepID=UPI001914A71C|nr:RHS repeat protein [Pseudomonas sp. TH39(2020)]MBK5397756.1 RHS repeat protein [Pseudomonas sp. TH39(2020)]
MSAQLHSKTPTLTAVDSRGLTTRHVAYWRSDAAATAQARITRQLHDIAGRLVAQWDPRLSHGESRANLSSIYSLSGRLLQTDSVDAGWQVNLPADAGHIVRNWDQRGNVRHTHYDDQLRPVSIQEQAAGDTLNVVERMTYGDSSPQNASRNLCGELTRHDDCAGTLITEGHAICAKPLGHTRHFLRNADRPNWPADEKACDSLLEDSKGHATIWQYDALGQSIQQIDAGGHRLRFSFDVSGQLKAVSLLIKEATTEQIIFKDLRYNAFGQVESQTAGNDVISRAVFDPASGRLTSLSASVSSSILQDLHYAYDAVGNVTKIEDKAQPAQFGSNQKVEAVSTFTYDSLYQLISATGREAAGPNNQPHLPMSSRAPVDALQLFNFSEQYEYDAGGNLTELRHVRDRNNYTRTLNVAAASNRLLSWNKGDSTPGVTATFDTNGNLQALQPGRSLQWNIRDQLDNVVLVTREDGPDDDERYCYDSNGQRVRKIHTTHAASVTHTREVRYLPGLEIRTRHNERLEVITLQAGRCNVRYLHWTKGRPDGIAANQLRYSLDDHLGSSSIELDDKAWLISQESYLPYGGTAWVASRSAVEADYRTIRYSGKERDASGLYYYGHRYYAPWLQRWISPDPAGPVDGLNLYAMVGNNPVRFIDHQGLGKIQFIDFTTPWLKDEVAKKIVTTANANAGGTAKKQKKPTEDAGGRDPEFGLSKNSLKDLVVHSTADFWDERDEGIVNASRFYNLNGPRSGPRNYSGVDNNYAGTATSPDFYLSFGSYKIGNTADYMTDLASRYSATKDDRLQRITISLDMLEEHPTLSRTAANAHELQQWTRDLIEKHIEHSDGIIPILTGGPGAHGEVRALNSIVALFPDKAERMLSNTNLSTTKLIGPHAPKPFIACLNCSGIIPKSVQVWTHRTPINYAAYNARVQQINGPGH